MTALYEKDSAEYSNSSSQKTALKILLQLLKDSFIDVIKTQQT